MDRRKIGALEVSAIGLGCNQLGTTCDRDASRAIILAAFEAGITFFDTAEEYGDGASESVIGTVLAAEGLHGDVVVATKFGSPHSSDPTRRGARPDNVRRATEDSLRRLQVDCLDLLQLHFPDPAVPIADTIGALEELRAAGKVREIGCSNFSAAQIGDAAAAATTHGWSGFGCVQDRLNLLRQEKLDDVVPAALDAGWVFLPFFPLAAGMLSGKYRRGEAPPADSRLGRSVAPEQAARMLSPHAYDRLEALERLAGEQGCSLPELALRWLLAFPWVASVIGGATRPEQVRANAEAGAGALEPDVVRTAGEIGRRVGGGTEV